MAFAPTMQQRTILHYALNTASNLAIVARAGCGKTTTILMLVDAIVEHNPGIELVVCAFNSPIAKEVGDKLRLAGHTDWKKVGASTIHSMGSGLTKFQFRLTDKDINKNKVRQLVKAKASRVYIEFSKQIERLVMLAKDAAFGYFCKVDDTAAWQRLLAHHDLNGLDDEVDEADVISAAQVIYQESLDLTTEIDFADMILFPLVKNLRVKFQKDMIIVDEAQDLSPARQALIKKFLKPRGRIVLVGDDRQAIYGFTGADADALKNMVREFSAVELPLSVTWRCPKAVVKVAQRYVPDIEAADAAPDGEVLYLHSLPDDIAPGDAILCRNTGPLIAAAYTLIRQGKPAKIEGRDVGTGLKVLAQRWKVPDLDGLMAKLDDYRIREVRKALEAGDDELVESIEDKVGSLEECCKACIKDKKTEVQDVIDFIDGIFADDASACIKLATYHRSKGREWKRVFLFEHATRCPSPFAKQPWQREQEANLAYVAITRSQHTLAFVG